MVFDALVTSNPGTLVFNLDKLVFNAAAAAGSTGGLPDWPGFTVPGAACPGFAGTFSGSPGLAAPTAPGCVVAPGATAGGVCSLTDL